MAEAMRIDFEAQRKEISVLLNSPMKKGDTWFLIDAKWYRQWKKYIGLGDDSSPDESQHPGPIDNTSLMKDVSPNQLKDNLMVEAEYVVVPELAWQKLVEWNKLADGQKPLARKVVEHGLTVRELKLEVYLLNLNLSLMDTEKVVTFEFSHYDTTETVETKARELLDIPANREIRMWIKYQGNTHEQLERDKTLQEIGLYKGQTVTVEVKNNNGTWPRQSKQLATSSTSGAASPGNTISTRSTTYGASNYGSGSSSHSSESSSYYHNYTPGLCGLQNLGNTCFMNSALQCMSNVPGLTEYFLGENWRDELNVDNPLGMGGRIANSFQELVSVMWSGKHSVAVPRQFKYAVGSFAPQFSGYNQHDAQELMAFLLDGLHEDLNRIKKKPYIEVKEEEGMTDEMVARQTWENYRKRNDSIIVDTFHGLLKSTLVCPDCHKVSETFDPFCYLSLPLPAKKERQLEVVLVYLDVHTKPCKFKVTVPKQGSVRDIYSSLGQLSHLPANKMLATEVYNSRFHKLFNQPDESIMNIGERDEIFIYQQPDSMETVQCLPMYHREKKQSSYGGYSSFGLFGLPSFVYVPHKCTYSELYSQIMRRLGRIIRPITKERLKSLAKSSNEGEEEEEEKADKVSEKREDTVDGSTSPMDQEESHEASSNSTDTLTSDHSIFNLTQVNSYASSDLGELKNNDKPLKFESHGYIAVDWSIRSKEIFYDAKAANDCDSHDSMNEKMLSKKHTVQLTECLDLFTTVEKLGEQDLWYCPRCKEHKQATKKFDLWQLPKVLVIHLKRFSYTRYWRDKIDSLIEFPTKKLDMSKWVLNMNHSGATTYDLIAVTNHYGGLGGGHYTAFAKNQVDSHWYHFDDSSVSRTSEDQVVTKASYVLVYQRRGQESIAPSLLRHQQNNHNVNNNTTEDMDSS